MTCPLAGIFTAVILLMQCSLPCHGQTIDQILRLNQPAKTEALNNWYFKKVRNYPPPHARQALASLRAAADKNSDVSAAAAAAYFRGQYLGVKLNDTTGIRLMKQGIATASAAGFDLQAAYYRHHLGYYYFFKNNDYRNALGHMLAAHSLFSGLGYRYLPEGPVYLNRMAFVFFHLGNYYDALEYLEAALELPMERRSLEVNILNTMGQCYRNLYRFPVALLYFTRAYALAVQINDPSWIGISAGSIGQLHIQLGNYRVARPYCQTYYDYSLKARDTACIAESLSFLSLLDLQGKDNRSALQKLNTADAMLETVFRKELRAGGPVSKENYIRQLQLFKAYAQVYQGLGEDRRAMHYMQLATMVRDSLEKRTLLAGSVAVKEQIAQEKHKATLQLLEREKQNTLLKQYVFIAALLMVTMGLVMAYNRQHLKRKQERGLQQQNEALMRAEKLRVEAELHHAGQMLENYTENLKQKNDLLEQVQTEIEALRTLHGDHQSPQILYLNTLARSSILTEQDWENFSHLFDKVHTGFLVKLKEKFPHLTPAEVRLLSLTRLKLSTKEMASMLGVSAETIKKTRHRLRKKIELEEDQSLEDLVTVI